MIRIRRGAFLLVAAVAAWAGGCTDRPSPAGTTADGEDVAAPRSPWPVDAAGRLREIGKYEAELRDHPELFAMSMLPGGVMPASDVEPLKLHCVAAAEVERLIDEEGFVLVDVRKDEDVVASGVVPGSRHHEYRFTAFDGHGSTELTREVVTELLATAGGVVFLCNGEKCPRSYNASITTVQDWGVPAARVRWFRDGLPAWNRSLLIPPR